MWNVKFWWPDHLQETTRKKQKKIYRLNLPMVCVCMCKIEIFISMFRFLFFFFFFFFNGTNGLNDCVYCVWWIKMWKVSSFFFSSYHNIIMVGSPLIFYLYLFYLYLNLKHPRRYSFNIIIIIICHVFSFLCFFFTTIVSIFKILLLVFFYMMKQNDYIGG